MFHFLSHVFNTNNLTRNSLILTSGKEKSWYLCQDCNKHYNESEVSPQMIPRRIIENGEATHINYTTSL